MANINMLQNFMVCQKSWWVEDDLSALKKKKNWQAQQPVPRLFLQSLPINTYLVHIMHCGQSVKLQVHCI